MAHSSIAIANFFIEKGIKEKMSDLTPMKLQKLVYFAHGWYLALNGSPLLTDRIEAWKFGPVINWLYKETRKWGNSQVTSPISIFDPTIMAFVTPKPEDHETIEFLESIWKGYAKHTAIKLSNATHVEGSPWDKTVKENGGEIGRHAIIDDQLIRRYFQHLSKADVQ